MVKNATGGSKTKGQGRKFVTAKPSNKLRVSEDPCEVYSQVIKTLGNGMCHVIGVDNVTRLCHIRGKFRGRGKRDNFIGNGSWVLVGLREWDLDKSNAKKMSSCDLLEVYGAMEKERLKSSVHGVDWATFIANDSKNTNTEKVDDIIDFIDNGTEEYQELIEAQVAAVGKSTIINTEDGEEIDVDDI
jgi:translation initiation factor IF-1